PARSERQGVQPVDGARRADHLLAFEAVGAARVLLDRQGVAAQPDHELPGLSGESGGGEQHRDRKDARSTAHVGFLVKGITIRVVSQSTRITPPLPCGWTAMLSRSTGRGSDSVFTSTRTRSESALYSVPHIRARDGTVHASPWHGTSVCLLTISFHPLRDGS